MVVVVVVAVVVVEMDLVVDTLLVVEVYRFVVEEKLHQKLKLLLPN